MEGILDRTVQWMIERGSRLYNNILEDYSPEEQNLIKWGSATVITSESKEGFEKRVNLQLQYIPSDWGGLMFIIKLLDYLNAVGTMLSIG